MSSTHIEALSLQDALPIYALVMLLQALAREVRSLGRIAGHEDHDTTQVEATDDPTNRVHRKRDPGPLFPWERVMGAIPLKRVFD
jgi:N-acetylmuramoyl-L-alanine amidase